ncbi:MAG: monofunctional biosynthetic peptidoglycan transglycosylase [Gracilimonas sp.]|uniref:monofunctional biosynthetic peptidoglycan transglycosylase n=1 Tax=Gracilimonas sp. TaxID=1974203 RepID=UPI001985A6CF|nr:monofunctional biosynthetic peptidoglycan transglycosylase [Gracilimonas sp.]MBD3615501.1 monofunctional biosynthetic peptidoglycan transglycosylase [Gracilimonas sp.]
MEEQTATDWIKYGKITAGVILGWSFWFCLLVLALRWVNPPFTAFTLQEDWEELGTERYSLRANWVPAEEIPDHLKLAVIASEDQRFYAHWGLDLAAIDEAIEENQRGRRVRGASTITQQVAKNLFLSPAQNYLRKGVEAGIAVLIEIFWTKDRILEMHLNIAEFGPGIYGIGKASEHWFGKGVGEMSFRESARLVTVLPSPKIIKAEPVSDYVENRSHWILRNMEQLSGLRFLPKPQPDTVDTMSDIAGLEFLPDSILVIYIPDTLKMSIPDSGSLAPGLESGSLMTEAELDSMLLEIELDSLLMDSVLDSLEQ